MKILFVAITLAFFVVLPFIAGRIYRAWMRYVKKTLDAEARPLEWRKTAVLIAFIAIVLGAVYFVEEAPIEGCPEHETLTEKAGDYLRSKYKNTVREWNIRDLGCELRKSKKQTQGICTIEYRSTSQNGFLKTECSHFQKTGEIVFREVSEAANKKLE